MAAPARLRPTPVHTPRTTLLLLLLPPPPTRTHARTLAGAWIGITPLFSAALGAFTYAFEPDPAAFAELIWNVRANADLATRISLHPM